MRITILVLLATLLASVSTPGVAQAQFLYAKTIPDVGAWTNESFALGNAGDCTSNCTCTTGNAAFNNSGGEFMTATDMDSLTLPPLHKIVAVRINALVRFDINESGTVRLRVTLPSINLVFSRVSSNITSDNECEYAFSSSEGDVTNEVAWTQALINDIQLGIRRESSNPPNGNQLKCDALRVRVITALDSDSDGVIDSDDNCDFNANPDQADSDGDGVGNACDNCVFTFNPDQTNTDGDSAGNACDGCATDPNKTAPGICGCFWPDIDWDGDGIADCFDNCDGTQNPNQSDIDGDGIGDVCDPCPSFPSKQMAAPTITFVGGGVDIVGQSSWPTGTSSSVKTVPTTGGGGSGSGTTGSGLPGISVGGEATVNVTATNDDGARISEITIYSYGTAFSDCSGCFANIFAGTQSTSPIFTVGSYAILDNFGSEISIQAVSGQLLQLGGSTYVTPGTYTLQYTSDFASAPGTISYSSYDETRFVGLWASDDPDNDGIPNCLDNCPLHANTNQANNDGDAFGNACDGCPNDPLKTSPGACGCGSPDIDSDGDGALNCVDGCPNDPLKLAPGICGCGVADLDSDGDGVANCLDECPGKDDSIDCNGNGTPDGCEGAAPIAGNAAALGLDGVDDSALVPGWSALIPSSEVTIEFWQRVDSAKQQLSFTTTDLSGSNRCSAHVPWQSGVVFWDFGDIGAGGRLFYLPPEPIVGSWQHFAFVASQSGNFMAIYRNGQLEASKSGMDPFTPTQIDFRIGGIPPYTMGGAVDEFRVWSYARTGAEIASQFKTMVAPTSPGLIGYWRFDEATGTIASNLASPFDATLVGASWEAASCFVLGDVDGNGLVGGSDLAVILGAWGTSNPLADLDASGLVDAVDIALLLGAWTG